MSTRSDSSSLFSAFDLLRITYKYRIVFICVFLSIVTLVVYWNLNHQPQVQAQQVVLMSRYPTRHPITGVFTQMKQYELSDQAVEIMKLIIPSLKETQAIQSYNVSSLGPDFVRIEAKAATSAAATSFVNTVREVMLNNYSQNYKTIQQEAQQLTKNHRQKLIIANKTLNELNQQIKRIHKADIAMTALLISQKYELLHRIDDLNSKLATLQASQSAAGLNMSDRFPIKLTTNVLTTKRFIFNMILGVLFATGIATLVTVLIEYLLLTSKRFRAYLAQTSSA